MDAEYDENRGNHAAPECNVSIARTEPLFEATETAWPWGAPADGDMTYASSDHLRRKAVPKGTRARPARSGPVLVSYPLPAPGFF